MSVQRYEPSDPREWLNRARSNIERAAVRTPHCYFEDLCFDAQQAAEKAIKAVALHKGIDFPYVHDLDQLLRLAENAGVPIPDEIREAGDLTEYAVTTRYPGMGQEVTEQLYREAMEIARAVVKWAESVVLGEAPS